MIGIGMPISQARMPFMNEAPELPYQEQNAN
jgi:hypothetical protein